MEQSAWRALGLGVKVLERCIAEMGMGSFCLLASSELWVFWGELASGGAICKMIQVFHLRDLVRSVCFGAAPPRSHRSPPPVQSVR